MALWNTEAHPPEGLLIDLSSSDDTAGILDSLPSTTTNSHPKDFPLPLDLIWETSPDLTHLNLPPIAPPLPTNVCLSPTAPAYVPKARPSSTFSDVYDEPRTQEVQFNVDLFQDNSPLQDHPPPTAQEAPQFKTYADASNYFYVSKDPSILEAPLATLPEPATAPVVPPSHPPEPLKYYTRPAVIRNPHLPGSPIIVPPSNPPGEPLEYYTRPVVVKDLHFPGRPNWEAAASDSMKNGEKHSENFPPNHHPLPGLHDIGQPVSGGTEDPWSMEIAPRWDVPETRNLKISQDPRLRCSPDQFADATNNPFEYPHNESPFPSERQATLAPPTKISAPSFDWSGPSSHLSSKLDDLTKGGNVWGGPESRGVSSTFDDPTKGDHGWGRSSESRVSSNFNDLTTREYGWAATDREKSWDTPRRGFMDIPTRHTYQPPEPQIPKHPAAVFSKRTSRDPNFVLPPPDEEPPRDTSWDAPEWRAYNGKKGRPLRLPDF